MFAGNAVVPEQLEAAAVVATPTSERGDLASRNDSWVDVADLLPQSPQQAVDDDGESVIISTGVSSRSIGLSLAQIQRHDAEVARVEEHATATSATADGGAGAGDGTARPVGTDVAGDTMQASASDDGHPPRPLASREAALPSCSSVNSLFATEFTHLSPTKAFAAVDTKDAWAQAARLHPAGMNPAADAAAQLMSSPRKAPAAEAPAEAALDERRRRQPSGEATGIGCNANGATLPLPAALPEAPDRNNEGTTAAAAPATRTAAATATGNFLFPPQWDALLAWRSPAQSAACSSLLVALFGLVLPWLAGGRGATLLSGAARLAAVAMAMGGMFRAAAVDVRRLQHLCRVPPADGLARTACACVDNVTLAVSAAAVPVAAAAAAGIVGVAVAERLVAGHSMGRLLAIVVLARFLQAPSVGLAARCGPDLQRRLAPCMPASSASVSSKAKKMPGGGGGGGVQARVAGVVQSALFVGGSASVRPVVARHVMPALAALVIALLL